jgi:hypothetical protein
VLGAKLETCRERKNEFAEQRKYYSASVTHCGVKQNERARREPQGGGQIVERAARVEAPTRLILLSRGCGPLAGVAR